VTLEFRGGCLLNWLICHIRVACKKTG